MFRVVFAFTLIIFSLNCYSFSDAERADLFGLSSEVIKSWELLSEAGQQDPAANLKIALEKHKSVPQEDNLQRYYAELVLVDLILKLENAPEAVARLDKILPDLEDIQYPIYLALAQASKSEALKGMGEYDEALAAAKIALKLFQALQLTPEIGGSHILIGQIIGQQGQPKIALEEYLMAYEILKEEEDTTPLASVLSAIGTLYDQTKDYEKAVEYYSEAIKYLDPETQEFYISIIFYNIGSAHNRHKKYDLAREYFAKALALSEKLNDEVGIAYVNNQLGEIEHKNENHELAVSYLLKGLPIFIKSKDMRMEMNTRVTMAKSYGLMGQTELALASLKEAMRLLESASSIDNKVNVYKAAAGIYENQNMYAESLVNYKLYAEALEEKFNKDKEAQLDELKVKFDSESKEAKNKLLEQENALQEATLQQKDIQQQLMAVVLVLSIFVVIGVVYFMRKQIKMKQRFAALAMTDELTKAPNRRHILEFAKTHYESSLATSTPLVIAILDQDHFKSINDTFGHDVGDHVLVEFYQCVSRSLRNVDRAGRLGGEEWLLVMPGLQLEQVSFIFHRIRKELEKASIEGLPDDYKITFSMGVAELSNESGSLEEFLKSADQAVYQAKEEGRDRWLASVN